MIDEPDRHEAIADFPISTLTRIPTALPPAERRPDALLRFADTDDPKAFLPYRLSDDGTNESSSSNRASATH